MKDTSKMRLIPLPFDVIEDKNGIILKRGCIEVKIGGERSAEIIKTIIDFFSQRRSANKDEICSLFPAPDRQSIAYLIDELFKRRMLMEDDIDANVSESTDIETKLDVFYWHLGIKSSKVTEQFDKIHIIILGVNNISRQLVYSLNRSQFKNIDVVDYPLLHSKDNNNSEIVQFPIREPIDFRLWEDGFSPKSTDCMVVTSDLGNIESMRKWNDFCVKQEIAFMPIVLRDLIGYVGPFVIPHETACYECFITRRRANMEESEIANSWENIAPDGNKIVGYHPSMASILSDIAVIELIKFYAGFSAPIYNAGKLIEVNMLSTQLQSHKILKIPRCKVCSTMNRRSSTTLSNLLFKI